MRKSKKKPKDASLDIRNAAAKFPGVDEGTACTQSSFKIAGKAFLFIGLQGGRHKAMFKLKDSISEAEQLAKKSPDDFQIGSYKAGSSTWVTARFSDEKPLPKKHWKKWLDESHQLFSKATLKKTPRKSAAKKTTANKSAVTKTTAKKSASQTAAMAGHKNKKTRKKK